MKYLSFFGLSAKPILSLTLVCGCLIALYSCDGDRFLKEVDVDLQNPEIDLVLESTIRRSDTLITVYFSKSQSILEEVAPSLIGEARVELFLNDVSLGLLQEVETNSWSGDEPGSIYQLDIERDRINPGDQIRIEATTPEGESVSAIEQMPSAANVVSATYLEDRQTLGYYYSDNSLRIVINDPGAEENRYVFWGEELVREAIDVDTFTFVNPIRLDPGDEFTLGDFLDYPIASDRTFNGRRGTLILGTWWRPRNSTANENPQLTITVGSMNIAGYDYDETLDAAISAEGNPFAEPAILPSSIEGGRGVVRVINDATMILATLE